MSGSAVTLSDGGSVAELRMNQTQANENEELLFKTMNLMRLSGETLRQELVPALDRLISGGATRSYVEQLLKLLIDEGRLNLQTARCGHLKWFEIDSHQDLQAAEAIFGPGAKAGAGTSAPAVSTPLSSA